MTEALPPEVAVLRAVETFWRALREASTVMVRDTECSRSTASLVRVLATRTRAGRVTQVGDVAHALRVDTSVASRQVSQLVDEGLVERTVGSDDRRARSLRLTPAGLERAEAIEAALLRTTADLFADWPAQDVAAAAATLGRLSATFDRVHAPAAAHERVPA
ncbi:MarR family winged helix-turn-helix transcriptional regulator [Cellulomonas persica]|uniref:HTH marR-type domain-containing protein n=1 Tax=Cellulomonas persica TaxID=76861 RepID=A0A510UVB5_9CELL|nr:MarR family transcriptional regulator [Cellulomonas persica]GEK17411.1 hypothetical protein CPE01_11440 [Cellulomonas persica]